MLRSVDSKKATELFLNNFFFSFSKCLAAKCVWTRRGPWRYFACSANVATDFSISSIAMSGGTIALVCSRVRFEKEVGKDGNIHAGSPRRVGMLICLHERTQPTFKTCAAAHNHYSKRRRGEYAQEEMRGTHEHVSILCLF